MQCTCQIRRPWLPPAVGANSANIFLNNLSKDVAKMRAVLLTRASNSIGKSQDRPPTTTSTTCTCTFEVLLLRGKS
eukprot:606784-Lingulodinium_polyedra.AAC.1